MQKRFSKFILLVAFLVQIACGTDCSTVDCASQGGTLHFRVFKDGENALFGDTIRIPHDSIRFFVTITDTSRYDIPIEYNNSEQSILLSMEQNVSYILQIDSLTSDTFRVQAIPAGMDDCCKIYQLNSATKNGQAFCIEGCNAIFDIQL